MNYELYEDLKFRDHNSTTKFTNWLEKQNGCSEEQINQRKKNFFYFVSYDNKAHFSTKKKSKD